MNALFHALTECLHSVFPHRGAGYFLGGAAGVPSYFSPPGRIVAFSRLTDTPRPRIVSPLSVVTTSSSRAVLAHKLDHSTAVSGVLVGLCAGAENAKKIAAP